MRDQGLTFSSPSLTSNSQWKVSISAALPLRLYLKVPGVHFGLGGVVLAGSGAVVGLTYWGLVGFGHMLYLKGIPTGPSQP